MSFGKLECLDDGCYHGRKEEGYRRGKGWVSRAYVLRGLRAGMKNKLCWQSQASCQAVSIKTCQKRVDTGWRESQEWDNARHWEVGPVFSTEPLRRAVGSRGVGSFCLTPSCPERLADSILCFPFWWQVSLMIKFMCSLFLFCRISWAKNVKCIYWNRMSPGFGSDYQRGLRGWFIHICYEECCLSSSCTGRNETVCPTFWSLISALWTGITRDMGRIQSFP